MLALSILSILIGVAIPALGNLIRANELRGGMTVLNSALAYARNEAVSRSTPVAICGSDNGSTCTKSTKWSTGWIIFIDQKNDGELTVADCSPVDECILKIQGDLSGDTALHSSANWLAFDEKGELDSRGANSLVLCGANANAKNDTDRSRTISISVSGSRRVKRGAISCP